MNRKSPTVALVCAIIAIIISICSFIAALETNRITEESSYFAYRANLPLISARTEITVDETTNLETEKLTISNSGEPLVEFHCDVSTLLLIGIYYECGNLCANLTYTSIRVFVPRSVTYASDTMFIPIVRYLPFPGNYTRNSQGLLCSSSFEGNFSYFKSMLDDFIESAIKDGYGPVEWSLIHVIRVTYKDKYEEYWSKYFRIDSHFGSCEIDEMAARAMSDWEGKRPEINIDLDITSINGHELWEWYKVTMLGE